MKTAPALVIRISQSTFKADNDMPMHFEVGFIKILPKPGKTEGTKMVEASFVHPFGMAEFEYGDFNEEAQTLSLALNSESILRGKTASGKQTTSFRREYFMKDGKLAYNHYMGVDGGEPYHHLEASLEKVI